MILHRKSGLQSVDSVDMIAITFKELALIGGQTGKMTIVGKNSTLLSLCDGIKHSPEKGFLVWQSFLIPTKVYRFIILSQAVL